MRHPWFNLRLVLVLGLLVGLYVPGIWLATQLGLPLPLVIGIGLLLLGAQYWAGNRRALHSVDARPLPDDTPRGRYIHRRTRALAATLDVPPPTVSVGVMGSPNAFALGRRGNGHIVLSQQLLAVLDPQELDAVIAHELSHLRSHDTVPMVIGQGAAELVFGVISVIEDLLLPRSARHHSRPHSFVSTAAHGGVMLLVFAISRQREYVADADAAMALDDPSPMQRALARLQSVYATEPVRTPPEAVESLCIASDWSLSTVLSSHPSLDDRIDQLDAHPVPTDE